MSIDFSFLGDKATNSSALPKALFTDPEVFELEKERIFRSEWMAVAREEQLTNPGDYITCDIVGEPLIVVRDKQGNINAFSNVCLHRACPIAEGSGSVKNLFVCPYHKWTYELDGKLRGTPDMEQAEGFDRSQVQLRNVAVECWNGWVFVNLAEDPAPLAPQLTELNERLAPYDPADFRIACTLEFDSAFNWKVLVENFMESYHHQGAHAETLQPRFPAKGTYAETVTGHYSLLENPTVTETDHPFWVGLIFPSLMWVLIRNGDMPILGWYHMDVDAFDHFNLKIHAMVPAQVLEAMPDIGDMLGASFTEIHNEDIPVCEGVWRGVNSRFYTPGRLSHLETNIWEFHQYLKSRMAAAG